MAYSNTEAGWQNVSAKTNIKQLYLNVSVHSNCPETSFNFHVTMRYNDANTTLKAVMYCLYMMAICALQGVSVLKLIRYFSDNDAEANKVS